MKKDYVENIGLKLKIATDKKTKHLLDGAYRSIYKGKSLDFDNLREYEIGDDTKNIEWKASAKTNKLLIKQHIAEKKHNVLFILDTNKSMMANVNSTEIKSEISIMTFGTIASIAKQNGDSIGAVFCGSDDYMFFDFKNEACKLEKIIHGYTKSLESMNNRTIEKIVDYVSKILSKNMIVFIITDIDGINRLRKQDLINILEKSNVIVINIDDEPLFGINGVDIEKKLEIPMFLQSNLDLLKEEKNLKENLKRENVKKLENLRIPMVTLTKEDEIIEKIIDVLERYKNGIIN